MNIPNYVQVEFVDDNKNVTIPWSNAIQQLLSQLQAGVGQTGFYPTPLTTAEIAALDVTATIGSIVYNITTQNFMRNATGVSFVNF